MNQRPTQPMEREAAAQLAEAARQQQPGAQESLLQQLYPMLAAVVHQADTRGRFFCVAFVLS